MNLAACLGVAPGVTAVIGSGGKTSTLRQLAEILPERVILCTTTHIRPFSGMPLLTAPTQEALKQTLEHQRIVCVGTPCGEEKLTTPALSMAELASCAPYVLVEADGSRRLPLKAHAAHEPVIPPESRQVICVVGASGLGRPIGEVVHRPERFCALTGASLTDAATPELAARGILAEGLCDTVFLNQIDGPADHPTAHRFAAALEGSSLHLVAGSLRTGEVFRLL